jgi:adenylate cyclase
MHEDRPAESGYGAVWKAILEGTDPIYARTRQRLKHLPSDPRCKMCAAPFAGLGAALMRVTGRRRWSKNPKYCGRCFHVLSTMHGGAEIEASFLFADVRGSTSLAEHISPTEFRTRLDRFYDIASRILVDQDAIVDKFVGDEVIGIFIPALSHDRHALQAIEAARALIDAMDAERVAGRELPIGVGVGSGVAFVGAVGRPPVTELTALGDIVNTTARLASAAGGGEILIAEATASAAGIDLTGLEARDLDLKGKSEAVRVYAETRARA